MGKRICLVLKSSQLNQVNISVWGRRRERLYYMCSHTAAQWACCLATVLLLQTISCITISSPRHLAVMDTHSLWWSTNAFWQMRHRFSVERHTDDQPTPCPHPTPLNEPPHPPVFVTPSSPCCPAWQRTDKLHIYISAFFARPIINL